MAEPIEIERDDAAARVWLNRPDVHNALNEDMVRALADAFQQLGADDSVRVIILSGRGKSFCAGADIESMKRQGQLGPKDNLESARELAEMFRRIASCAKPTIARVNGAAIGGGMGLVCACDIAIAAATAVFATSEVRLGLIPATIGPYVVHAIGPRWARRLFLTGERIGSADAKAIALVHTFCEAEKLDDEVAALIDQVLKGAPQAQEAAKNLVDAVAGQEITPELIDDTAMRIAHVRAQQEAREGLQAFLQKRTAAWIPRQ